MSHTFWSIARIHHQVTGILYLVQEWISRGKYLIVNKVMTPKLHKAQSSCWPATPQAGSPRSQLIQHEKSFTFVSMENETTSRRRASTSQRTGNKPMAMRTWRTDEDLMAVGIQWTNVSLMAIGA